MSSALPENITVKRLREDTFAEIFTVGTVPDGATFELTVEGYTSLTGTIDGKRVSFDVSSEVADADIGRYDYEIVMTVDETTRTIVVGDWVVSARSVE